MKSSAVAEAEPPVIEQGDLFAGPAVVVQPGPKPTLEERFQAFHTSNPDVYRRLTVMARDLLARGRSGVGIGMLWETLRYEQAMTTTGEPYKLNNSYRSRYSRTIMEQEPDLRGFFTTRELAVDGDEE